MLNSLVFYNNCNRGDLHVSRELVKIVARCVPSKEYYYAHNFSNRILLDLPLHCIKPTHLDRNRQFSHDARANILTLNTWYGVSPRSPGRCHLSTLVDLFQFHIERHEINCTLPPLEQCIPTIDYSKYNIAGPREFMQRSASAWRKRVMVCDGPVLSRQTGGTLEDFRAAVLGAAIAHPDVLFLMTERGGVPAQQNIMYTADITGQPTDDLNECSYISTQCDVVIGRGSGPYTFAYVAENFGNPKKTMLCFTDSEQTALWAPATARMLWSNNYDLASIRAKIEEALS